MNDELTWHRQPTESKQGLSTMPRIRDSGEQTSVQEPTVKEIGVSPGCSKVIHGDCLSLIPSIPNETVDVVVTSPPYWGQRQSMGAGTEEDPREYLRFLRHVFTSLLPKLKEKGILWINLGDAYNTPINWSKNDHVYSSLGQDRRGFSPGNAAYTKPRFNRKAFVEKGTNWLQYGNMLMLPQRLVIDLVDSGYVYRGEVVWSKKNAMPEGRCRRPHRKHEPIFLLAKSERHDFRSSPPVPSVWQFSNESIPGLQHRSRFPKELPKRCIEAYGQLSKDTLVFDPFAGSGSTGMAALHLGCSFLGMEIDGTQAAAASARLAEIQSQQEFEFNGKSDPHCDAKTW